MSDNQEDNHNTKNTEDTASDELFSVSTDDEWQDTLNRLGLDDVELGQVTDEDLLYLAKRWQFLQVVELSGSAAGLDEVEIIKAPSGWNIQYYGDAMATSPGRLIYWDGDFRIESDDSDGGSTNLGVGTLIKQAFDTATEMVRIAQEREWGGMIVVDGHPDMMRAAWIEAVRIGVRLDGYTPSVADERIRRRVVSQTLEEMQSAIHDLEARIKSGA